jgi:hypothetical protein
MVNFGDLNLSVDVAFKEIDFKGQKILVKSYVSNSVKAGIINLAARGAFNEGVINTALVDAYIHMFIIEYYTDIKFGEEDSQDIISNYDKAITSGLLSAILEAIPEEEYDYIIDCLKDFERQLMSYSHSYAAGMAFSEDFVKSLVSQNKT